jgi:hypothetical protein
MTIIPIYAQYKNEKGEIITKEVTIKDFPTSEPHEIGINVDLDRQQGIKIAYFPSNIKMAGNITRKWAEENNIIGQFLTYMFTANAQNDWWAIQPREAGFTNYYYESNMISTSKRNGLGIIIRDINLPAIESTDDRATFKCNLIPF